MSKFDSHERKMNENHDERGRFAAGSGGSGGSSGQTHASGLSSAAKKESDAAHKAGTPKAHWQARDTHKEAARAHMSDMNNRSLTLDQRNAATRAYIEHTNKAVYHSSVAAFHGGAVAQQTMKTPGLKPKQGPEQQRAVVVVAKLNNRYSATQRGLRNQ